MVIRDTGRQRNKFKWELELIGRSSGDCVINFIFLLLEDGVDSSLTSTSYSKYPRVHSNQAGY